MEGKQVISCAANKSKIICTTQTKKHRLWHGHHDTTRYRHWDTDNVKNIGHRDRYIYIIKFEFYLLIYLLLKIYIKNSNQN
jgi:hypothetical protein